MNYIIKGDGALVNEAGEMKELKTGDFALVDPNEKHHYRNLSPDKPFKMICGVPKEFEYSVIYRWGTCRFKMICGVPKEFEQDIFLLIINKITNVTMDLCPQVVGQIH